MNGKVRLMVEPSTEKQGCIIHSWRGRGGYQVCWGRISSCEDGKRILWLCRRILYVENRERGDNITFHTVLMLLERISSGEKGKAKEISGKKIKILKNGDGREYQVVGNFIHPCKKK